LYKKYYANTIKYLYLSIDVKLYIFNTEIVYVKFLDVYVNIRTLRV